MALSVKYGLPAMFTVVNHPLLRQRQAVTSEMPACSQNLCRLKMGLPSIWVCIDVFTPPAVHHQRMFREEIRTLEPPSATDPWQ